MKALKKIRLGRFVVEESELLSIIEKEKKLIKEMEAVYMLPASKALEMSNKASPKKETSDIDKILKRIEKYIQKASKAGERQTRWTCDSIPQAKQISQALSSCGYVTSCSGLDALLTIRW